MSDPPARKNIRLLTTTELDNLVKAFAAIQKLPPDDPNSFFVIAGYHGEPFRGAGYANSAWWGGYCNHGNVLFPTWHRAYVRRLERALQSKVPGVTMPYWDETEEFSLENGIPPIFLQKTYTFADDPNNPIPNPLFSYTFQSRIVDRIDADGDYTKPVNYETVRYPFSGLVGNPRDIAITSAHNKKMRDLGEDATNQMLNDNIVTWLTKSYFKNSDDKWVQAGVNNKFNRCLDAPNYTVFSNTTSAQHWNEENLSKTNFQPIVPLESPHNSIHLAVGGFDVPNVENIDQVAGANGDMAENDTAAFDPIFFFHHCFIDLTFWRWQQKQVKPDELVIIPGYPGTNSVDSQGPTPGVAGGTWLTMDSPLDPFKYGDLFDNPSDPTKVITSKDVVSIANLNYKYEYSEPPLGAPPNAPAPILTVSNINRATIAGSFVVTVWAKLKTGKKILLGTEAVLSRWHVTGCRNCQNHLEVRVHFPIEGWKLEDTRGVSFEAHVKTRRLNGDLGEEPQPGAKEPRVVLRTDHL